MDKHIYYYNSTIGELTIIEECGKLVGITFGKVNAKDILAEIKETDIIKETIKQLTEYFEGKRKDFTIQLEPLGTEFQKNVWNALLKIPYGETRSYKEIAEGINSPKACRAVGMANNKNPIPIIIPCHRVIGSSNKLVGYAGGLDIKRKLLELENLRKL